MFTTAFASEMADRLLASALEKIEDPQLRELLQCQAYFHFYSQCKNAGIMDPAVESDAPSWLQLSLQLLEPR